MMVVNSGVERRKSNASVEAHERKFNASKTSVRSQRSLDEHVNSRRPKSSSASDVLKSKKTALVRSRTADGNDLSRQHPAQVAKSDVSKIANKKSPQKHEREKSETSIKRKTKDVGEESQKSVKSTLSSSYNGSLASAPEMKHQNPEDEDDKSRNSSFTGANGGRKITKTKSELSGKKHNEIPKPKFFSKSSSSHCPKTGSVPSKLPLKITAKETEPKTVESVSAEMTKTKPENIKSALKTFRVKREAKIDENNKELLKVDFSSIIPLYETELKKITNIWVNAIYCSLTMRTNLVKILFQAFPQINKSQFQTEDDKLLHCIAHAKSYTKSEAESLIQFVRSLLATQEKSREQCRFLMANKEIAKNFNNDWRSINRKISEITQEVKQIQSQTPECQKKKETSEAAQNEIIRSLELNLANKEEELEKLINQLDVLKLKESQYEGNVLIKVQDYKHIKADVQSLRSVEKEFDDLKSKFLSQNETYDRKVRELEGLLEEKKKVLDTEKNVKAELQTYLKQRKQLAMSMDKDQLDYILGRKRTNRDKRREQLWVAAVKLILRGFVVQMKKLERDKNKMLLELQSSNTENFNAVAESIIKKDNFIKTVTHQMKDFQKVWTHSKSTDHPCIENIL